MADVFRALADPRRRALLDQLAARDGQTLTELAAGLPELTRFGVMNHLKVLQDAELISTRKAGRYTYHYLNPVPIQLAADRWISRYAAPWAHALGDIKRAAEEAVMTEPDPPRHVYTVLIRASPEQVWQAITDPLYTSQYFFGTEVTSDWAPGSPFVYTYPDGTVALEGKVLKAEPPNLLVTTFDARWEQAVADDPPSRATWQIEPAGEITKLTVTHDGFAADTATFQQIGQGVPTIISSLKSLLETGAALRIG